MRYTGKPLSTAGDARARNFDARKLIERQNIEAAGDVTDEAQRRAPADWVLLRRQPNGDETVVATNVVAFDVTSKGAIFVSDGDAIERIDPDGKKHRLARAERALALATIV